MSLVIPCAKYKELHFIESLFKYIHATEQQYTGSAKKMYTHFNEIKLYVV